MLMMAMVDYPYPAAFFGDLPAWPVAAACNLMLDEVDEGGDELKALAVAGTLLRKVILTAVLPGSPPLLRFYIPQWSLQRACSTTEQRELSSAMISTRTS